MSRSLQRLNISFDSFIWFFACCTWAWMANTLSISTWNYIVYFNRQFFKIPKIKTVSNEPFYFWMIIINRLSRAFLCERFNLKFILPISKRFRWNFYWVNYLRSVSIPSGKSNVDEAGSMSVDSLCFNDISFSQAIKPRSSLVPVNCDMFWKF